MGKGAIANNKALAFSLALVVSALVMLTVTFAVLYFEDKSTSPTAAPGDTSSPVSPPVTAPSTPVTNSTVSVTSTTPITNATAPVTASLADTNSTLPVTSPSPVTNSTPPATTSTETPFSETECVSGGCLKAANALQRSMNRSVNPCDNFYDFACGTWAESHPMPLTANQWDAFGLLGVDLNQALHELLEPSRDPFTESEDHIAQMNATEKAQFYYGTCVDEVALEAPKNFDYYLQFLQDIFPQITSFPYRENATIPTMEQIAQALINARKYGQSLNIITAGISPDTEDSTKPIIVFIAGQYGPDTQAYLKRSNTTHLSHYQAWMMDMLLTFTRKANMSLSTEEAETLTLEFYDYEAATSRNKLSPVQAKNKQITTHKMTMEQFATGATQHLGLPTDKLVEYFRNAWDNEQVNDLVNASTIVNVMEPGYYQAVINFFGNAANDSEVRRLYANYISFQLATSFTSRLGEDFSNITRRYLAAAAGITEATERWVTCITRTQLELPDPVGRLYVMEHFHKDTKKRLEQKVDYLFNSLRSIILDSEWMTATTRLEALRKAQLFKVNIGYDDAIVDSPEALDEGYRNFSVSKHSYVANSINYRRFVALSEGQALLTKMGTTSWLFGPATINAWYIPNFASITFPAAILQPPFFGDDYPDWWNFGAIGTVIGHEITHGFDDIGSLFDGYGNLVNWWDIESRMNFEQRKMGLVQQYNGYEMQGERVNGTLTIGENIADNGALKEAFQAYRLFVSRERGGKAELPLPGLDYNAEQLFFIANAQAWCSSYTDLGLYIDVRRNPHAPGRFRVIGPMQNYDEFSKAFNCSADSYMNPVQKNGVW
ncbi:endothelin-converting enzyme homolog [Paramacrobiotus metropolitanus]|uniref:endothelin-converting enzyme homolog n=1 Tax=Paramacrobiotus metropolitanus TaxID=2943436 RepID=UPI00244580C5|nr:endothelin-converting enzyme homolog [Paramacrobiotus metropolitanus]